MGWRSGSAGLHAVLISSFHSSIWLLFLYIFILIKNKKNTANKNASAKCKYTIASQQKHWAKETNIININNNNNNNNDNNDYYNNKDDDNNNNNKTVKAYEGLYPLCAVLRGLMSVNYCNWKNENHIWMKVSYFWGLRFFFQSNPTKSACFGWKTIFPRCNHK